MLGVGCQHTNTIREVPPPLKLPTNSIPVSSTRWGGAFTYSAPSTVEMTSQVSLMIEHTVDLPKRKLNDKETWKRRVAYYKNLSLHVNNTYLRVACCKEADSKGSGDICCRKMHWYPRRDKNGLTFSIEM